MSNWALIIGINSYELERYRLNGALNDALGFLKWCRAPSGGAVPAENIHLLLDPQPPEAEARSLLEGTVCTTPVVRDAVSTAISTLITRSNGTGERCFVYFAGHGLSARSNGADVPCICLRNFTPDLTHNALSLPSVLERFRATRFQEQYFFIDACRNVPFVSEFLVSDFDRPVAPTAIPFPQFVAHATQPRNTAQELIQPGYEGGAFTQALLEGLAGRGTAKQWDGSNGEYLVRWNSLFKYVAQRVSGMRLSAPIGATRGLIQEPRQYGEKGTEDPVLARFAENHFGPERLQIDFNPRAAANDVKLSLGEAGLAPDEYSAPLKSVPLSLDLAPRIYGVVARNPNYQSKRRMELVELYDTLPITIDMLEKPPAQPASVSRGIEEEIGPPGLTVQEDLRVRGGYGRALRVPVQVDSRSKEIASPDRLAQLQIAHESGLVMISGRGKIALPASRAAGFYRARIIAPDGEVEETLTELSPDGQGDPFEVIPHQRLSDGVRWAIDSSGIPTSDGLIIPSEAVGPCAFVKLSTLLALAAGAWAEGRRGSPGTGSKLRSIPLPPLSLRDQLDDTTGGIQLLLGDECLRADWGGARVRIEPAAGGGACELPVRLSQSSTAIACAEQILPPGSYRLSIEAPAAASFEIALTILASRISLLVVTQELGGALDLHQYSLLVVPPSLAIPSSFLDPDPELRLARFASIRRIELMQRAYLHGRASASEPDIQSLLEQGWADPIAGCLGGYMLVAFARAGELAKPAVSLCERYPLPDAWVLRAAYLNAVGKQQEEERAALVRALELGIPVFSAGIRILAALTAQVIPEHPAAGRISALGKITGPGGLFSAFPLETLRATRDAVS